MIERVRALLSEKSTAVIGIDGMICAGKSTLARQIAQALGGNTVQIDDFYLPAALRTDAPAGNIDFARLKSEVIERLGNAVSYRVFSCAEQRFSGERSFLPSPLTIIEGSYALHPSISGVYDLKIFMRIPQDEQRRRVYARDGREAEWYFSEWIPRERVYFGALNPARGAVIIDNFGGSSNAQ